MTSDVLNDNYIQLPKFLTNDELSTQHGISDINLQTIYHNQCIHNAYRADKWYNIMKQYCPRMEGIKISIDEAYALYWYVRERQIELRKQGLLYKTIDEIKHDKAHRKHRKKRRKQISNGNNNHSNNEDSDVDKENVDPKTGHNNSNSTNNNNNNNIDITTLTSDELYELDFPVLQQDIDEQEYVTMLRSLRERITDLLIKSGLQTTGFLITLDGHSCLDSSIHGYKSDDTQSILADNLSSTPLNERDNNVEAMLLYKSYHNTLHIYNDKDLFELLSYSYNILTHLKNQLLIVSSGRNNNQRQQQSNDNSATYNSNSFDVQIIFHEWLIDLPIRSEYIFRTFIHNNKLTAATQKQNNIYYDDLIKDKNELQTRIYDYINNLLSKKSIPYDNCIADVLLCDTYIILLDIKPYYDTINAGCYNWSKHEQLLKQGPYKLKLLDSKLPNINKYIHPVWLQFIEYECKPVESNQLVKSIKNNESVVYGLVIVLIGILIAMYLRHNNINTIQQSSTTM